MTAFRVVVTRPRDDAAPLARALADAGVEVLVAPLMTVALRPGVALGLAGAQAVLLTSANGARALAALTPARAIPVLAVGDATAAAARAAGFAAVASADGEVAALAALAVRTLDPAAGDLVHVAGTETAGDLAGSLAAAGFAVRRCVAYEAMPCDTLPAELAAALEARMVDAVLFFSPRTARTFVNVVERAGCAAVLHGVEALCLSPAVATAAAALPWQAVRAAARPRQDSLIELVLHRRAEREEPDG